MLRLFLLLSTLLLPSCYLKSYPVTPEVAENSTYRLSTPEVTGTAWVVAPHFVVTAGHLCDKDGPYVLEQDGWSTTAERVIWTTSIGPARDACIMYSPKELARPLVLAKGEPAIGTPSGYVGYPYGEYGAHQGVYEGNGASSAWCAPGASGSAQFTAYGVWGVLVDLKPISSDLFSGDKGCLHTPIKEVKDMLNMIEVGYTLAPDYPEPI